MCTNTLRNVNFKKFGSSTHMDEPLIEESKQYRKCVECDNEAECLQGAPAIL